MKMKEIFDQLTYGELSQLSIGGMEAGAITEANFEKILPHVNLGLTALYKRFPLKEGRVRIALQPGWFSYPISSKYAMSNPRYPDYTKFIQDSAQNKFTDDILKIEKVYVSKGTELPLNDESDPYSVFTPSAAVLRVPGVLLTPPTNFPEELVTTTLDIVYRANHPLLGNALNFLDLGFAEVELPYTHLEPLLLFIASRVHTPTGMTNETNMGNTYAAKYEAACQEIETRNLRVDNFSQPDKILRNGWV
jgi:hypothetical protein